MNQAWLNDPRSATAPGAIDQAVAVGSLIKQRLGR